MNRGNTSRSAQVTESYWPADRSEPILDATIGQLLRQAALKVPDHIALVEGCSDASARRRWTYAQLLTDAERVASALVSRFQPGARIAIWAPNIPEWELLQMGASLAGMVLVTVNPAFKAQELTHVLRQSRAQGLFYLEEYRGNNMTAILAQARKELPDLQDVIGFAGWQGFIGSANPHKGIVNASRFMANGTGLEPGGVWVNAMPMFHIGGCGLAAVGTLAQHGKHVLVPGFDAALILELIESEQGTFMLAVPTMLSMLLDHPDSARRNLSTLRTVISGASMVPAALVRRVQKELDCQFSIVFGQTELHGIISNTHHHDTPEDQSETIGQPMAQVEVKIVDLHTNQVLPIGEQGEICARGYQAMLGYFDMPEATAATLEPDGWLHTGDLGTMDKRGYLRITGRLKDMIIRGGENIYPREIEMRLSEHPEVANAVIIGVPDEKWGEQVAAIILPVSIEEPPSPEELQDYCRANLAVYKTPKLWFFVDQYPLTATGKIQKFVLQESVKKGKLVPISVEKARKGFS